jgi:SPFH domain / Band 7 family
MVEGPTEVGGGGEAGEGEEEREEPSRLGAAATLTVSRETRRERRRARDEGGGTGGTGGGAIGGTGGAKPRRPRLGVGQRALTVLVVILLLAFGPAFVSGLKKTPRNMIGISYGGGPFESAHFQRIVKPGSALFFNGWYDPLYLYPADEQNYIISKNPRVGAVRGVDSVLAPTSDRVPLTFQAAIYFKLNTDLLRQFHEQLGLQYKAYTSTGWNNLLQDTFRQQVENAIQQQTRRYTVAQLYGNGANLVQLQDAVQTNLAQRLITALGAPFFCSPLFKPGEPCQPPTFIVKQIDVPAPVVNAFQAVRTSAIQIQVLQNQVLQREAEAQGIAALNKQLSIAGMNYVLLKAIESGSINFWVLPSNAGVTLAPGSNLGGTGTTTPSAAGAGGSTTPTTTSSNSSTTPTSGP